MASDPDGRFGKDEVEGLVEAMLGAAEPQPIRWAELSGQRAEQTLTELARWGCRLVARYQLDGREVPPCWWHHGALVEELTALWGRLGRNPRPSRSTRRCTRARHKNAECRCFAGLADARACTSDRADAGGQPQQRVVLRDLTAELGAELEHETIELIDRVERPAAHR